MTFEDEVYAEQQRDTFVSFDVFMRTLENFLTEEELILVTDSNHELDSYFND